MALDPNRWTVKTQEAFNAALDAARRANAAEVTPDHMLASLLEAGEGVVVPLLQKVGVDPRVLRQQVAERIGRAPKVHGGADPTLGRALRDVLERADSERTSPRDDYLSTEHVVLAMADLVGATRDELLTALQAVRGSHRVTSQNPEEQYQALERFGRDLTEAAAQGKLDPVIGRDEEIRRVIQVLSRRTKNNPVLIGEPGVGKTAIVEGLARRIVEGDVAEGEIVSFIDELHTIVGAGGAEGAVDAGNMIKPMLARGELRLIGATTLDEYRKHVEKDAALERRFQPVYVGEPSVDDTIAILRGLKERYEVHHGVRIQDAALVAAAVLSQRYVSGRQLPDKAIDLVDEAASRLRIEIDSLPIEVDVVERRIRQLEIEKAALAKETDEVSKQRLHAIEAELAELIEKRSAMVAHWENEKRAITEIRDLKEQLEGARTEAERAEREGDLERAAQLRYGTMRELEQEIEAKTRQLDELQGEQKMLKEEVDEEDIAEIVSKWTGIPVTRLMEGEMQKLVRLEDVLHERVIGQDDAVRAVANAIRRSRAGLSGPKPAVRRRPYAVILLDEIEKAHSDVFNVLLQIMDDGRLTDGQGRTVDFKNTVLIM